MKQGRWFFAVVGIFTAMTLSGNAAAQEVMLDERGNLREGDDEGSGGRYVDIYDFEALAGDTLVVRVTSSEFDPTLVVRAPGRIRHTNDNENRNSLHATVIADVPRFATYTVEVSSAERGETGRYEIKAHILRAEDAVPLPSSENRTEISGELGDSDPHEWRSGPEITDGYVIRVQADEQVIIALESRDFDPMLDMRCAGSFRTYENDDADGTNARLAVTPEAGGFCYLDVETFAEGEMGDYQLTISGAEVLSEADESVPALTLGEPVSGQLAAGQGFARYRLSLPAAGALLIDLESEDFDTYLAAYREWEGPSINTSNDGVGIPGTNSRVYLPRLDTDFLTIFAGSIIDSAEGRYTLSARLVDQAAIDRGVVQLGQLSLGETVTGTLSPSGTLPDNSVVRDVLVFEGTSGQQLRFDLVSDEFDPILRIEGPGDFVQENDDIDLGVILNSRIDTTLPADGTYYVSVRSYASNTQAAGTGVYNLSVRNYVPETTEP